MTVDGPVEIETIDRLTRINIATRYLRAQEATEYIDGNPDADEVVVRLRPVRLADDRLFQGGPGCG